MQAPSAPSTIKEKLLADIRAGEWNPNLLGKRHGLNGHDLVKNLEQLRKEGFIAFKWGLGDRIEKVWIPKGKQNMTLLEGHVGEDKALYGDNVLALSGAISRLPWDGEWRKWDADEVQRLSGLKNAQITGAMRWLRDSNRIVQLGGGHRGVRIHGVRWRGERPPEAVDVFAEAVTVVSDQEPAPEPAQGLGERYPMISMIIQLGKELEELTRASSR